jgi:hypothetical protein
MEALNWSICSNKAFLSLHLHDKVSLLKNLNERRVQQRTGTTGNKGTKKKERTVYYSLEDFNADSRKLLQAHQTLRCLTVLIRGFYENDPAFKDIFVKRKDPKTGKTTKMVDEQSLYVSFARHVS